MREILLNICMTAIALCLFKMLIPEGTMKKQTNFLIACFFLASLIFFFSSGKINFNHGLQAAQSQQLSIPHVDFEEEYTNAQKRAINNEMAARLSNILSRHNIFPEEIYTSVNISDKYSISINEIRLVFLKEGEEESDEEVRLLGEAMHIVKKEVGDDILITGEFDKSDSVGGSAAEQVA